MGISANWNYPLTGESLTGLHTFHHLPSQLTDIAEIMPYTVQYPIIERGPSPNKPFARSFADRNPIVQ
jgi:hypothetical protein